MRRRLLKACDASVQGEAFQWQSINPSGTCLFSSDCGSAYPDVCQPVFGSDGRIPQAKRRTRQLVEHIQSEDNYG